MQAAQRGARGLLGTPGLPLSHLCCLSPPISCLISNFLPREHCDQLPPPRPILAEAAAASPCLPHPTAPRYSGTPQCAEPPFHITHPRVAGPASPTPTPHLPPHAFGPDTEFGGPPPHPTWEPNPWGFPATQREAPFQKGDRVCLPTPSPTAFSPTKPLPTATPRYLPAAPAAPAPR